MMSSNKGYFGSLDQRVPNPLSPAKIDVIFWCLGAGENKIPIYFEPIINHSSKWPLTGNLKDLLGDNISKSTLNKLMQHCRESSVFTFFRAKCLLNFAC